MCAWRSRDKLARNDSGHKILAWTERVQQYRYRPPFLVTNDLRLQQNRFHFEDLPWAAFYHRRWSISVLLFGLFQQSRSWFLISQRRVMNIGSSDRNELQSSHNFWQSFGRNSIAQGSGKCLELLLESLSGSSRRATRSSRKWIGTRETNRWRKQWRVEWQTAREMCLDWP